MTKGDIVYNKEGFMHVDNEAILYPSQTTAASILHRVTWLPNDAIVLSVIVLHSVQFVFYKFDKSILEEI